MLRLIPFLLALLGGYIAYRLSNWRMLRDLGARSIPLADALLLDLAQRFAQAIGTRTVSVSIYDEATINGLAASDGRIYLTRGLYEAYRSGRVEPEEIAAVIAHEIGHIALGHARRRMLDFSGQNAVRMVLGLVLSRLVPGLGAWLADGATRMLAAKLSRADEFEADAYGAALLSKVGLGPAPLISVLDKLDHWQGASGAARPPAWLASHPKTADRIAALRALGARWAQTDQA